ncbi:FAD binding domain-containing protein [candidate division KSB1 bacterium]
MYIADFKYHRPASVPEACKMLSEFPEAVLLAGGTDLLVEIRQGLRHPKDIVSLTDIPELKNINETNGFLIIGAGETHNDIADSPVVEKFCKTISETASKIGTDQIRNTGTIGGNLCTGASCCDFAPILLALNADVKLIGVSGDRIVPLTEFFISHKDTRIQKGEILTEIIVPRPESGTRTGFEKFGLRNSASISVVSAAVSLNILPDDILENVSVVLGAVAPTPVISFSANRILNGCNISDLYENSGLLQEVGEAAVKDAKPVSDIRGSDNYRRELIKVLVKRLLLKILD